MPNPSGQDHVGGLKAFRQRELLPQVLTDADLAQTESDGTFTFGGVGTKGDHLLLRERELDERQGAVSILRDDAKGGRRGSGFDHALEPRPIVFGRNFTERVLRSTLQIVGLRVVPKVRIVVVKNDLRRGSERKNVAGQSRRESQASVFVDAEVITPVGVAIGVIHHDIPRNDVVANTINGKIHDVRNLEVEVHGDLPAQIGLVGFHVLLVRPQHGIAAGVVEVRIGVGGGNGEFAHLRRVPQLQVFDLSEEVFGPVAHDRFPGTVIVVIGGGESHASPHGMLVGIAAQGGGGSPDLLIDPSGSLGGAGGVHGHQSEHHHQQVHDRVLLHVVILRVAFWVEPACSCY